MPLNVPPQGATTKFFCAANSQYDIVAVASSAGGLSALSILLSGIPGDFPGAFVIVQHLAPGRHSQLARILNKKTELIVKEARNLELISPHTVYMAPPDAHILVKDGGRIHLTHSVQVNFVRPSADLLFDSLAVSYPARVVGVVLTGKGTDGTEGVKAIRKSGGKVIAQDRLSSEYFDMPSSAINAGCVDLVLSLEEIPPAILNLFSGEIQ